MQELIESGFENFNWYHNHHNQCGYVVDVYIFPGAMPPSSYTTTLAGMLPDADYEQRTKFLKELNIIHPYWVELSDSSTIGKLKNPFIVKYRKINNTDEFTKRFKTRGLAESFVNKLKQKIVDEFKLYKENYQPPQQESYQSFLDKLKIIEEMIGVPSHYES